MSDIDFAKKVFDTLVEGFDFSVSQLSAECESLALSDRQCELIHKATSLKSKFHLGSHEDELFQRAGFSPEFRQEFFRLCGSDGLLLLQARAKWMADIATEQKWVFPVGLMKKYDPDARERALMVLREMSRVPEALQVTVPSLIEAIDDMYVAEQAMSLLGYLHVSASDPSTINRIISYLSYVSGNDGRATALTGSASWYLRGMGRKALPFLMEEMRNANLDRDHFSAMQRVALELDDLLEEDKKEIVLYGLGSNSMEHQCATIYHLDGLLGGGFAVFHGDDVGLVVPVLENICDAAAKKKDTFCEKNAQNLLERLRSQTR